MSLTNAVADAPSFVGNVSGSSITYTTLKADTLVVGAYSSNSGQPTVPLNNTLYSSGGWSGSGAAGWSTIATAGSQTDTWTEAGTPSRPGIVVAGFSPIPEPSSAARLSGSFYPPPRFF